MGSQWDREDLRQHEKGMELMARFKKVMFYWATLDRLANGATFVPKDSISKKFWGQKEIELSLIQGVSEFSVCFLAEATQYQNRPDHVIRLVPGQTPDTVNMKPDTEVAIVEWIPFSRNLLKEELLRVLERDPHVQTHPNIGSLLTNLAEAVKRARSSSNNRLDEGEARVYALEDERDLIGT